MNQKEKKKKNLACVGLQEIPHVKVYQKLHDNINIIHVQIKRGIFQH